MFKFQKPLKEKMDLNNGLQLIYSNFGPNHSDGNLQESNSESLQELSDYFDSNPATPVKDIGAPIEDTQIVTVAMNLSDMFETVDIVEDTNRKNIVPSSCSLVNSETNSVEGEANNNNLLSRGNGSQEPTLSTNIGVEENQSKQLGEGDTEGEDAIYNVKTLLIFS